MIRERKTETESVETVVETESTRRIRRTADDRIAYKPSSLAVHAVQASPVLEFIPEELVVPIVELSTSMLSGCLAHVPNHDSDERDTEDANL